MKRFPSFFLVAGLAMLLVGLYYLATMMTGFPNSWPGTTFSVWLRRIYTLPYPYPGPTEEAFDHYSHLASVTCWLGFGLVFWSLVADGCILKQTRSRQIAAALFCIITLFCAILQIWVCAHWYWICNYSLWVGYQFDAASMFFTFPAALVCTVLSLILVGARRGMLSLISFCSFALPLWETLSMVPVWQQYIALKYGAQ